VAHPRPARYFPVKGEPLRMQPGLFRFGTDFGNGAADNVYFQVDEQTPRWLGEKARVLAQHPERSAGAVTSPAEQRAVEAARSWLASALARERGTPEPTGDLSELGLGIAEDFVVLHRTSPEQDRAVWVHACFPSGWRPEQVLGHSFLQIHARVPGFEASLRVANSLVDAMVERGPYVRFVWTVTADEQLDHHPEHGLRETWSELTRVGFLRVERQVSVPLPDARAALFLIRTHLYPFDELSQGDRLTLHQALSLMPASVVGYKRLEAAIPQALRLLASAG
jgi:hypothetical protein